MNRMDLLVNGGLFIIFLCVLILPFKVKQVEHNLEVLLFACGIIALTNAGFMTILARPPAGPWRSLKRHSLRP